jgi:uncharacterized membrane protein
VTELSLLLLLLSLAADAALFGILIFSVFVVVVEPVLVSGFMLVFLLGGIFFSSSESESESTNPNAFPVCSLKCLETAIIFL